MGAFRATVRRFYRNNARPMPWRVRRSPYRVLVSELMLQQTSVPRVFPRYPRFISQFPSFRALADASVEEVLRAWKGLGYNRRALALLQTARIVSTVHHGRLPRTVEELVRLPGIGQATAAAVIVYAFDIPVAFIETNVRRVFLHFFFPVRTKVPDSEILPLVEQTMDRRHPREWFYALMDYGTMLATQGNANRRSRRYRVQSRFEGSHRQLRGRILSFLLESGPASRAMIEKALPDPRVTAALSELESEGFILLRAGSYSFR